MRLTLTYRPGELPLKREALLRALGDHVLREDPRLADRLYKAMEPPESQPRQRGLQALQHRFREGYAAEMSRARKRIAAILAAPDGEPEGSG